MKREQIIEILRSYRIWFGDAMAIHEDAFNNLADEINALKAMQAYHEAKLRTGDGMDHVCQSCESKNQQPINQWQLCPKCAGQGRIWTPPNWLYN